ncbi:hypothetical protein AMR41_17065 [Hapalosiphon sp. MRB220]|nr:hypothetical protein AMR41_17065 [Hapalosiphon sp. MRB220]
MKRIIAGALLALPLAVLALPTQQASALEIKLGDSHNHRREEISRARAKHRVYVPAHWERTNRGRRWVPAHYEYR